MKVYYCDHFAFPLPDDHRFPVDKYNLLRRRLLDSGVLSTRDLEVPDAATDEQLLLVHSLDYLRRVAHGELSPKEIRRIGLPWSPQLVERSRRSVGGTIAACRSALEDSVAVNLGGGTHHAAADQGAGFCIFNDVAVAARTMQTEARLRRVVIMDCDVHQGDGTASIFADDASIFTFSIHGERNFPYRKGQSDLDVGLPDGIGDADYLQALRPALFHAIDQSQADLAIYLAGADPFQDDAFGRLRLTKTGLAERDRLVFDACRSRGLPVAVVMSGGYAPKLDDVVDIHLETIRLASQARIPEPAS